MSKFLFLPLLVVRIYFGMSSRSVFFSWVRLEINMLRVLPLLRFSFRLVGAETALKYLLVQAWGSRVFLWGVLSRSGNLLRREIVIIVALGLKLGVAPMHLWFVRVIRSRRWEALFLLSSVQKLLPIYLLVVLKVFGLAPVVILRALVGRSGVLLVSGVKSLIAYSSVYTAAWLISGTLVQDSSWILYLLIYSLGLILLVTIFSEINAQRVSQMAYAKIGIINKLQLLLVLVRMGGLPPLVSFWAKIAILSPVVLINLWGVRTTLILTTIWVLYAYIRLVIALILVGRRGPELPKQGRRRLYLATFLYLMLPVFLIYTFWCKALKILIFKDLAKG